MWISERVLDLRTLLHESSLRCLAALHSLQELTSAKPIFAFPSSRILAEKNGAQIDELLVVSERVGA